MKIGILSTDFKPRLGGIAELAHQICRELAARGHQVDVITHRWPGLPDEQVQEGVRVHRAFDQRPPHSVYSVKGAVQVPLWSLRSRWAIRKVLRQVQPEVLFCTNPKSLWLPAIRAIGRPYLLFVHGDDVAAEFRNRNPVPAWLTRKLVGGAAWTFYNSSFSQRVVQEKLRLPDGRGSVAGCGFPQDQIVAEEARQGARAALGWDDRPVLLTVCRLVWRKGIDTTLRALSDIAQQFPDCRYMIAGDGPDREKLQCLARVLGVDRRVTFLGRIEDDRKRLIFLASDLYVMPSRPGPHQEAEGFGISFLEANAYGLAVVGSTAGGIPEAVGHGVNGLLVPPDDPAALAQAVCELLADPKRRGEMARAGQERIRQRFNWRAITDRIEEKLLGAVRRTESPAEPRANC